MPYAGNNVTGVRSIKYLPIVYMTNELSLETLVMLRRRPIKQCRSI